MSAEFFRIQMLPPESDLGLLWLECVHPDGIQVELTHELARAGVFTAEAAQRIKRDQDWLFSGMEQIPATFEEWVARAPVNA